MDVLVATGVLAGWIYGALGTFFPVITSDGISYLEVSIGILAFVLLGKYIEEIIRRKSAASIRKLLELKPTMARVLRDGKEVELLIDELQVGDIVIVKPGEKIPTDGVVMVKFEVAIVDGSTFGVQAQSSILTGCPVRLSLQSPLC